MPRCSRGRSTRGSECSVAWVRSPSSWVASKATSELFDSAMPVEDTRRVIDWAELMSELVRGQVTDRPWGLTLGALALRGLTGRLVLPKDGYTIAFREGAVVHALSKDPRDAAVRIAVTSSLVTPPHAAQIA